MGWLHERKSRHVAFSPDGTRIVNRAVQRDERLAIPIGSYSASYGVTLCLPSVIGRKGILEVLEPELSEEEPLRWSGVQRL